MRITVRLGEPIWREVDRREVAVELPEGATVADLLEALGGRYPALQSYLTGADTPATVFLGDEIAGPDAPLTEDSEPLLAWPLAGG